MSPGKSTTARVSAEVVTLPAPEIGAQGRSRVSLMLLDEHPLAVAGVVAIIRAQPGFSILAASAEVEEAVWRVQDVRPEVLLLNLREGPCCLALAGAVHGAVPDTRVIVMGVEPLHEDVQSLVRARVSGFIMADESFDQLLRTIHLVAQGVQVLPQALTGPLFRQLNPHGAKRPRNAVDFGRLTGREREVAALIVRGVTNQQIADRLSIALHTVKSHVHRVLSKLAIRNRIEMAEFCLDVQALTAGGLPLPGFASPSGLAPVPLV